MTKIELIAGPGHKVDRPWRFLYSERCVIFWAAVQSSLEILTVERIFSSSPKSVIIIGDNDRMNPAMIRGEKRDWGSVIMMMEKKKKKKKKKKKNDKEEEKR